ncbi:hypothetical protein Tcan_17100 [Toxocara canis]|uniref:Uncharacterized protein n=1 Tax=Toxocara canis TaxID=6265 RepID=A0A0B2V1R1_TOXCA|nr:hypothetical protein Tcan_17100 [Toxocara canis]
MQASSATICSSSIALAFIVLCVIVTLELTRLNTLLDSQTKNTMSLFYVNKLVKIFPIYFIVRLKNFYLQDLPVLSQLAVFEKSLGRDGSALDEVAFQPTKKISEANVPISPQRLEALMSLLRPNSAAGIMRSLHFDKRSAKFYGMRG